MHYLQTEFTKNERDRINWELERCEMKARIAQLEGENRDLRYELIKLRQSNLQMEPKNHDDINFSEPQLLNSKLSVQENVKEIIYLLKSPQVTEKLDSWNNRSSSLHFLETMNLNSRKNVAKTEFMNVSKGGVSPLHTTSSSAATKTPVGDQSSDSSPINKSNDGVSSGYESDQETILMIEQTGSSTFKDQNNIQSPFSRKNSFCSLGDPKPGTIFKYYSASSMSGATSLNCVDKISLYQTNLLTLTTDGKLKRWVISSDLKINDARSPQFYGMGRSVIGIFWWDMKTFMTINEKGLDVWSVNFLKPLIHWDCFKDLQFQSVNMVDYENKWLLLKLGDKILMWKLDINNEQNAIKVSRNYELLLQDKNPSFFILGLSEESIIVLYLNPCHCTIYNFRGKVLQKIDLSNLVKDINLSDKNINRLLLNKKTSKLLIQINNQLIIYSFDQKKPILNFDLQNSPTNIIFKFNSQVVVLGYDDGTIEIRDFSDFKKILKSYNHYEIDKSAERIQSTQHIKGSDFEENKERLAKKSIKIDIANVNNTTAILSAGYTGLIRLDTMQEVAF